MKKSFFALSFLLSVIFPFQILLAGSGPLDTIRANVTRVLDVLRDPALKGGSGKEAKEKKLEAIADETFDYTTLSRLTLSRNWNKLSEGQRKEFVGLYRQILENTYMDKVLSYTDEKVSFDKETLLSESKAEVHTRIITKTNENVPIVYRMNLTGGTWKVYDVVVEGISLVSNYRAQFEEILSKNSPDGLLELMRKKVREG
jgi:phospholipid transport system substrate-binding protein